MEHEGIELSREKVRRTLRACGILSPRKKRAPKHRSRRERRAGEGMMLQVDGSPHDWLEERGSRLCLVGGIDDASGKVRQAFFEVAESSWAYFRLFSEIFKTHGLPHSVYADRHSIFWTDRKPTLEEQLVNKRPTTEVGSGHGSDRAMSHHFQGFSPRGRCYPTLARHFHCQDHARKPPSVLALGTSRRYRQLRDALLCVP